MRTFSPAQLAAQERFKRMVKSGAWPRRRNTALRPIGEALAARKAKRAKKWGEFWARKRGNPGEGLRSYGNRHPWNIVWRDPSGETHKYIRYAASHADARDELIDVLNREYPRGGFRVISTTRANPTLMVMNPGRTSILESGGWGVFRWRADGRYVADEAEKTFVSEKVAGRYAERMNRGPEGPVFVVRTMRLYPLTRGNPRKWIQSAIRRPGAFSAKARRAGMSTGAYARKVLRSGSGATTRTKRQAALARTLGRLRPNVLHGRWPHMAEEPTRPLIRLSTKELRRLAKTSYAKSERKDIPESVRETYRAMVRSVSSELRRRSEGHRGNPSVPSSALRMYRRFHGSDPMNVRKVDAPPGTPKHLVMLGKLTELGYRVPGHSGKAGQKNVPYLHKSGRGNILATDATGRNLFILKDRGSRMRVKSDGIND